MPLGVNVYSSKVVSFNYNKYKNFDEIDSLLVKKPQLDLWKSLYFHLFHFRNINHLFKLNEIDNNNIQNILEINIKSFRNL